METKDIVGLIITFLAIILFQVVGRSKKKSPPPRIQPKKVDPVVKKERKIASQSRPSWSARKDHAAYLIKPKSSASLGRSLFPNKSAIKKAFIMQEILKKPYE